MQGRTRYRQVERSRYRPNKKLLTSSGQIHRTAFIHMAWDFKNGWFGIRRVVDTWLVDHGREALDEAYVNRELQSMGLAEFRDRMCRLGRVVMGEESLNEWSELLINHAFETGLYGTGTSHKAGRVVMMSADGMRLGKLRSQVAAVFLPLGRMRAQFPELERWPVLLPVCWARRIVRYLRSGDLARWRSMLDYSDLSGEEVDRMRRAVDAGGL